MIGHEPLPGTVNRVETGEVSDSVLANYGAWLYRRQPQIGMTLATLARADARPAMYHCAGGKDRTGSIPALLLGIAGVPPDTIAKDYALSATYLSDRFFAAQAPPWLSPDNYRHADYQRDFCPPDAILKVLGYIDARYGGIEGYARTVGLRPEEIQGIRNALVE